MELSIRRAIPTEQAHKPTFIQLGGLVLGVPLDVLAEPLVELIVRVEQGRHDKVQQGPQLCN